MRKFLKIFCVLTVAALLAMIASVLVDKNQLSEKVIRLHVVAASDSAEDQTVKLKVKDAVMSYLQEGMTEIHSHSEAEAYLYINLDALERISQNVLVAEGFDEPVNVSLEREPFPIREYDTFKLPSGVYSSLRIRIGEAKGQNWWCVVFPSLCMPAAGNGAGDVSVFSDTLNDTIQMKDGYEVRFLLLDWLGNLENFFFQK